MGLATHVEALVAAFDLEVVRLLRDAIRTTAEAGRLQHAGEPEPAAIYEPRRQVDREPIIEPALRCRRQCESRIVSKESAPAAPVPSGPASSSSPPRAAEAAPARPEKSAVQPPWDVLPWNTPAPLNVELKKTVIHPDIIIGGRGMLLDLFI